MIEWLWYQLSAFAEKFGKPHNEFKKKKPRPRKAMVLATTQPSQSHNMLHLQPITLFVATAQEAAVR